MYMGFTGSGKRALSYNESDQIRIELEGCA